MGGSTSSATTTGGTGGTGGTSSSATTGGGQGGTSSSSSSASTGGGQGSTSGSSSSASTGSGQVCDPGGVWIIDPLGETVKDTVSGLTWQHGIAPQFLNWANAQTYCAGLGLAGGGWKLPDLNQLMTLVVPMLDPNGCHINSCAFPASCNAFWSTAVVGDPAFCWMLDFQSGNTIPQSVVVSLLVRCVR